MRNTTLVVITPTLHTASFQGRLCRPTLTADPFSSAVSARSQRLWATVCEIRPKNAIAYDGSLQKELTLGGPPRVSAQVDRVPPSGNV